MISVGADVLYAAVNADSPDFEKARALVGRLGKSTEVVLSEQTLIALYGALARKGAAEAASVIRYFRRNPNWRVVDAQSSRREMEAVEVFRAVLSPEEEQENFFVLPVDTHFHPLSEPLRVTRGTRDATDVHVREVFREAIRWNARGVMVAHNHPTGDPTPSEDDLVLTRRLIKTARVLGVELLDHLVLGSRAAEPSYVSLRQQVRW